MTSPEKWQTTARPGRGLIILIVISGFCLASVIGLLFWDNHQQDLDIDGLAGVAQSNENTVDALCKKTPRDPICKAAKEIPDTSDVVDQQEIQDAEVQDPEIQDPEIQDRENQQAERQDAEGQDPEAQDGEVQDPEPDDPEAQDPEVQDPEIDDPDPNSALNFEVADNCTPPAGEVVTDVGLQVRRDPGVVTYIITCQTAATNPPATLR